MVLRITKMTNNNNQTRPNAPPSLSETTQATSTEFGKNKDDQTAAFSDKKVEGGKSLSIGEMSAILSDKINNNLILARYGATSVIVLLGIYGLKQIPLFGGSRFTRVSDIPRDYFTQRKRLHCRLVGIQKQQKNHEDIQVIRTFAANNTNNNNIKKSQDNNKLHNQEEQSLTVFVYHLSPIGRIFLSNKAAFDLWAKFSPTFNSQVFPVEIAGLVYPSFYHPISDENIRIYQEQHNDWINELIRRKTKITVDLVARRISTPHNQHPKKKKQIAYDNDEKQTAIAKISYYTSTSSEKNNLIGQWLPPIFSIYRKDLAESLVQYGRASVTSVSVTSLPLFANQPNISMIQDYTPQTSILNDSNNNNNMKRKLLQKVTPSFISTTLSKQDVHKKDTVVDLDVLYLESLLQQEKRAIGNYFGMWQDKYIRLLHQEKVQDVIDEQEEKEKERNTPVVKKVWNYLFSKK